jgi:transposase
MTNDKTMWTETTREQYQRKGLRYSSDMTDAEWSAIEALLPPAPRLSRPRTANVRAIVNGILYLATSGCQWRQLPKDFPPMTTVQRYFYRWRDEGTWETINHALVVKARENMGREASPTAGSNPPSTRSRAPVGKSISSRPRRGGSGVARSSASLVVSAIIRKPGSADASSPERRRHR